MDSGGSIRFLLGRGSVYTIATAVQLVATVLVTPLVTRLVTPEEFGRIAAALIVLQLSSYLSGLGLVSIVDREFYAAGANGLDHARRVAAAAVRISATTLGSVYALWAVWAALSGGVFPAVLQLAVIGGVPATAFLAAQQLLRVQDRPGWFVAASVVGVVGGQGAGVAATAWRLEAAAYLAGLALGQLAAAGVATAVTGVDLRRVPTWARTRATLAIAAPTVIHLSASYVLVGGDRLVLQRVLGSDATGRYQVAYAVGSLGSVIVTAFNNAWAPLIYRAPDDERGPILAATAAAVQRLMVFVTGGLATASPAALVILAPLAYRPLDLVPVVAVVAASAIPLVWYLAAVHIVFKQGHTIALAVITPSVALFNLLACAVLARSWGLVGAAVATVGAYALLALAVHAEVHRIERIPWDWASGIRAAGAALVVIGVGTVLPVTGTGLVLRGAFLVVLACGLMIEVRRLIRRPITVTAGSSDTDRPAM